MSNLIAGAIGSLVTLTIAFVVRLAAAPGEIRSHDRRVTERDEDLAQWIADRNVSLLRELQAKRGFLSAEGMFNSGEYGYQIGALKGRALHEWRDQERQARRDVDAIHDREGHLHRFVRALRRTPQLRLTAPGRAAPVLAAWRAPLKRHLQSNETPLPIDDPTARTLDRAIHDANANPSEYE
jgi:hypothetical protein